MWIEFILNEELIQTEVEPGLPLLDFIRVNKRLTATKTGCREGDCGACAVLEGSPGPSGMEYSTIVSCLTPMINMKGKHIVTVEGLNMEKLNPAQSYMVEHSGTQCGFCTPGFIISMSSYLINKDSDPRMAIGGNICRCTGYKSIERAIHALAQFKKDHIQSNDISELTENGWLPSYFDDIPRRLKKLNQKTSESSAHRIPVAGGTDLMVQVADQLVNSDVYPLLDKLDKEISQTGQHLVIGAGVKISDFFRHRLIRDHFLFLQEVLPWFASEPIRNMGTLSGNIVNASPIGDLTIVLLALNASIRILNKNSETRTLPLHSFYKGYKTIALEKEELISHILLKIPSKGEGFNFLKTSKRSYLDIASVNSAMLVNEKEGKIQDIGLAAGGVAAIPLFLHKTCTILKGQTISPELITSMIQSVQEEIAPISDVRGTATYKRLLLRQQLIGHFIRLFPGRFDDQQVLQLMKTNTIPHEEH